MKKHSLAEFFKSKSFYVLLGIGALAIIAITVVSLNQPSGKNEGQNLADLNTPDSNVADNGSLGATDVPDNTTPSDTAKNVPGSSSGGTKEAQVTPTEPGGAGDNLESANAEDDPNYKHALEEKEAAEKAADASKGKQEDTAKAADDTKEVMTADSLYFDTEKGLSWPINGDVLINYSPDRVIYFKTLEQFRCNPAVVIQAKVGAEVTNAATGIITSITKEDETGVTVKVNIGSGYSLVYGQLDDSLKAKVGDMVEKGEVLGTIAKPTMYYSVEGGNLYFMVEKNKETLDPMTLLKK
ncbi:M23 family metallopeptidase [Anaerocolumna xylanovorans]|uniref:Peptidase family M23 n=1 Tax=Anaerocolumna xylanovorans DSM 12503 TaxID=1121345 RepID=A0A1M7YJZ2_9FIRM|nr:M23 family metallopeptidase [Anaerocolumna xylanovorans]SHO52929.1 Peptidase family M23 [Anaerocolumna xylanovorans DSM 12503]